MKTLLCAAVSVAALGAAVSAQAQGATGDWTGPYVAAHAGWGWQAGDDDDTIRFDTNLDNSFGDTVRTAAGADAFSPGFCSGAANTSLPGGGCEDEDGGFEFGGRVGYDWQFGAFVVGALVEGSRTNVTDSVSAFSTTPAFYTMERKLKGLGALRARAGYAMGDSLLYVTGGGAIGDVKHSFRTSNAVNTFTAVEDDDTAKGWQLGGGVEHKFTPDVSMGLEYIYTNLETDYRVRASGPAPATNPFILVNGAGTDFVRNSEDFETHSVRLTANYRF